MLIKLPDNTFLNPTVFEKFQVDEVEVDHEGKIMKALVVGIKPTGKISIFRGENGGALISAIEKLISIDTTKNG